MTSSFQIRSPTEKGVALLLVLGTVLMVSVSTLGLVRFTLHDRVRRTLAQDEALVFDLAQSAEGPIQEWLFRFSERVVLPMDVESPEVELFDERWSVHDRFFALRITAFDQYGMVAAEAALRGSPMRLGLPTPAGVILDERAPNDGQPWGLDLFRDHGIEGLSFSPFPSGLTVAETGALREPAESPSLGASLATHNPSPGLLNVHTAPLPLLELAFHVIGRSGLEAVIKARAEGRLLEGLPGAVKPNESSGTESSRTEEVRNGTEWWPVLVTRSGCWSFRVDAQVDRVRRSFWAIYVFEGEGDWSLIQRLAIHD